VPCQIGLGIEIWGFQSEVEFDNFYLGHSLADALEFARISWGRKYRLEFNAELEAVMQDKSVPWFPWLQHVSFRFISDSPLESAVSLGVGLVALLIIWANCTCCSCCAAAPQPHKDLVRPVLSLPLPPLPQLPLLLARLPLALICSLPLTPLALLACCLMHAQLLAEDRPRRRRARPAAPTAAAAADPAADAAVPAAAAVSAAATDGSADTATPSSQPLAQPAQLADAQSASDSSASSSSSSSSSVPPASSESSPSSAALSEPTQRRAHNVDQ
jgi:hypothetical protein